MLDIAETITTVYLVEEETVRLSSMNTKEIAEFITLHKITLVQFMQYNQQLISQLPYRQNIFVKGKFWLVGFTREAYAEINKHLGTYKRGRSATQTSDGIFIS